MWDKLRGKSPEEKAEENRLEIQKKTDKLLEVFKKEVIDSLRKLGTKETSFTLSGYPAVLIPSFITAKFENNESKPVTLIQLLEAYVGTPRCATTVTTHASTVHERAENGIRAPALSH